MIDRQAALQTFKKPLDFAEKTLMSQDSEILIEKEELFKSELDLLGAAAIPEKLQQIFGAFTEIGSATAQFLMGYLASYEKKSI